MAKKRKKPFNNAANITRSLNSPTLRVQRIAEEIVVECGERDTSAWSRGLPIVLQNGERSFSNSIAFRKMLAEIFEERHGERPSFGVITRALGFCNRRRFRKPEE